MHFILLKITPSNTSRLGVGMSVNQTSYLSTSIFCWGKKWNVDLKLDSNIIEKPYFCSSMVSWSKLSAAFDFVNECSILHSLNSQPIKHCKGKSSQKLTKYSKNEFIFISRFAHISCTGTTTSINDTIVYLCSQAASICTMLMVIFQEKRPLYLYRLPLLHCGNGGANTK